jgi:hypothetical protein
MLGRHDDTFSIALVCSRTPRRISLVAMSMDSSGSPVYGNSGTAKVVWAFDRSDGPRGDAQQL